MVTDLSALIPKSALGVWLDLVKHHHYSDIGFGTNQELTHIMWGCKKLHNHSG